MNLWGARPAFGADFCAKGLLFLDHLGLYDHHRGFRHIAVSGLGAGVHRFDLVDHTVSLDHLAEHRISPSVRSLCGMVEKGVVFDVDEKLGGGALCESMVRAMATL